MNLYLRLLFLLLKPGIKKKPELLQPAVLHLRVLPNDLDFNLHMNNGRYLSIMDLGRIELIKQRGLIRHMIKQRWVPIVAQAQISYYRPLNSFQSYELSTQLICWDDKYAYFQQTFTSKNKTVAVAHIKGLLRSYQGTLNPNEVIRLLGYDNQSPACVNDISQLTASQSTSQ
ncbi:MAG: thioesterase family protein [Gammaproteobacteria bacterium]